MINTNPSKQGIACLLVAFLAAGSPSVAFGQTVPPNQAAPGGDPWPRNIASQGATIQVYQPQLETWSGNMLRAYAAVSVRGQGSNKSAYGVIWFSARTEVDKVNRLVTLQDFKLTRRSFPSLSGNGSQYAKALESDMPWRQTIPLDLLETSLATTLAESQQKKYPLQNQPPRIIVSTTPAVLALIDGRPALRPAGENLQRVVNTHALVLFAPSRQTYYLALMDGWVQSPSVEGPWSPAANAPVQSLNKLKAAALAKEEAQVLGNPDTSLQEAYEESEAPAVYVGTGPAELLLLQGQPQFDAIPGTNLLYVSNTGADIFMNESTHAFYLLLAGRWFSSGALESGEWSYVPGASLPPDFARIPSYGPKASVLVSIPGTPQAKEALIANEIPQTAAISRTGAKLAVVYQGAPSFEPVQGTSLQYAVNSAVPVIATSGNGYYAVQNGVWFNSPEATGPWTVTTSVPPAIYSIPPSSSIHYVTYVYVYGYTPSVVYAGYTPGYYGTVVSDDNVVVYGTGWYYPPYIGAAGWIPSPYTYGVGAAFSWSAAAGWGLGFGLGMAVGSACGPWWGPVGGWGWGYSTPAWGWGGYGGAAAANVYGHWGNTAYAGTRAAWANPYTGNVGAATRGAYYNPVTGNSGVASRAANYNAYTGNYAARGATSGNNNRTGTSYAGNRGTVGNAYTGNYASVARGATYNPSTGVVHGGAAGVAGNSYTGQAVAGSRGYSYNTNTGNGVAHAGNNVYADHDGNVYRYNQGSGWQQHDGQGWRTASGGLDDMRSTQAARGVGDQRWGNFHSGGWGGGFGGGGWADRGRWGGGGFGGADRGGFGGFHGGGFRR
jgi:hypothetical protein